MKSWLDDNDQKCIQHIMKENLVVAGNCFRTLKDKICKCMASVSKKVYWKITCYS